MTKASDMRTHDDRRQLSQRRIPDRFAGEGVDSGSSEVAGPNRLGECFLIDDPAAGDVHHVSTRLHRGERLGTQQSAGALG